MAEEERPRMYRIQKVVHEMCKDRKYLIPSITLGMTYDQFKEKFQSASL